jgi:heptosyltransferase-3
MEFENVWNIAVFKFRNIGDVLLMTPALRAIRHAFPRARIVAIVNSVTDAMLEGNPHVDEVIAYGRGVQHFGPLRQAAYEAAFAWDLRKRGFDLTIDLSMSDRAVWCSLASSPRYSVSFLHHTWGPRNWRRFAFTHAMPYPENISHEVEKQLQLLAQFGIRTTDDSLVLRVKGEDRAWAKALIEPFCLGGRPVVHVHPVSRWLFKCWHDDRMAAVIDWLEEECRCRVIVTSSANERELTRSQAILRRCRTSPIFLPGTTSLGQLAALSQASDCFFGVDTAPMHMAGAVGTPVVALFGPSHSASWAPWSARAVVLQKIFPHEYKGTPEPEIQGVRASMDAISVAEAKDALSTFLMPAPSKWAAPTG